MLRTRIVPTTMELSRIILMAASTEPRLLLMPNEDADVDHCFNTGEENLVVTATFCDLTNSQPRKSFNFFKLTCTKRCWLIEDNLVIITTSKSCLVFYKANLTTKNNYTIFSQNNI
ncbi:tetratricopeptide repeat protein GNN-like [Platysternon megacephalum]|uniref:Tetratricopeptide repeat protein GNN-like n=1 Tax=Platysternon megacephalum TaxID=55544 RepID=A0A4D9EBK7_9SAUR|nr:tetratricopeptide repeat protein GNN-like [Platysternon megacephalum]